MIIELYNIKTNHLKHKYKLFFDQKFAQDRLIDNILKIVVLILLVGNHHI